MLENVEELTKKLEAMPKLGHHLITIQKGQFSMQSYELLTPEQRQNLPGELEGWNLRHLWEGILSSAHDITTSLGAYAGGFRTPIEMPKDVVELVKKKDLQHLNSALEDLAILRDVSKDSKKIICETYFSEEAKAKIDRRQFLTIRRYGHVDSFRAAEDYEQVENEKLAILDLALKFYDEVIGIYRDELRVRELEKTKIPILLDKARDICKEAEKSKKVIENAAQKCVMDKLLQNYDAAELFLQEKKVFDLLEEQHIQMRAKVVGFGIWENVKENFPHFPSIKEPEGFSAIAVSNFVLGAYGHPGERKRREQKERV